MKTAIQRKPTNYKEYENRSLEYILGEIAHTERSARKFRITGDKDEEEDRTQHARNLYRIYAEKTAAEKTRLIEALMNNRLNGLDSLELTPEEIEEGRHKLQFMTIPELTQLLAKTND